MGSKTSTHREEIFQGETFEMEMTWFEDFDAGLIFDLSTYINPRFLLFQGDSPTPIQFSSVTLNDGTTGPNIIIEIPANQTELLEPGSYDARVKLEDALGGVFILPDDQFITVIVKELDL